MPPRPRRPPLRRLLSLALVLLAGCADLGPDQARVVLRFREAGALTRERFVATIDVIGHQWYYEGSDLDPAGDGWAVGREISIGSGEAMTVTFAIRGGGTRSAARGEVDIPRPHGARWRIDVFASSLATGDACGGCDGIQRFTLDASLRPTAQDWLYLSWTAIDGAAGDD